jgi:hypothetical protein
VLNAIYEGDFLGFSYGFRPGRSQHDALDALATAITGTPVYWILDADIRGFFDSVNVYRDKTVNVARINLSIRVLEVPSHLPTSG